MIGVMNELLLTILITGEDIRNGIFTSFHHIRWCRKIKEGIVANFYFR
jgi:hypothetical protein